MTVRVASLPKRASLASPARSAQNRWLVPRKNANGDAAILQYFASRSPADRSWFHAVIMAMTSRSSSPKPSALPAPPVESSGWGAASTHATREASATTQSFTAAAR